MTDLVVELSEALNPYSIPPHVMKRVNALLMDEDVVYVDGEIVSGEERSLNGKALFFTAKTVLLANWQQAFFSENLSQSSASAEVRAWSRSGLNSLSVEGDVAGRNVDRAWHEFNGDIWPYSGLLVLRYDQSPDAIQLPMGAAGRRVQHEKLYKFVPSLIADLG